MGEISSNGDYNVLNFVPTIYRHKPIDHDDHIDVLFYIGSKTPLHINMMIGLYIGCKPIVDDIYVYICFVLGVDPKAHD